jgi:hypothetical protein
MDEESVMFLSFCLVILLIALTTVTKYGTGIYRIFIALIIVAAAGFIVVLNFADYLIVSMVFSTLGITFEPASGYKIVKEQNAIVKEVGGIFYATGFLSANLYAFEFKQELEEDDRQKMMDAPESWERAVANIGFPFKFHVVAAGLNVQNIRDELEGKRGYQEYQLSKAMQNSDNGGADTAIAEIHRKINVIQRKMDRIATGEKPIGTVMYVESIAVGISEKAALDELTRQLSALQISLGPMNVDLARITGRELYTLFKFNYMVPQSYNEIITYFETQS